MEATITEVCQTVADSQQDATVRYVAKAKLDQWVRQGDVYAIRVSAKTRRGQPLGTRQVALGTSGGSRHIAEGERVKVYRTLAAPELDYCLVVSPERWKLTHPEHAHMSLPAGVWLIRHQLDVSTRRRVID